MSKRQSLVNGFTSAAGMAKFGRHCGFESGGRAQAPGSSTRLRARYAITLARLAHRSEQYRLVRPAEVSMNTPEQGAAWHTPNRSMPSSVSRTARPIAAPAAYLSDTEPLSV